jgi:hypothetical protein
VTPLTHRSGEEGEGMGESENFRTDGLQAAENAIAQMMLDGGRLIPSEIALAAVSAYGQSTKQVVDDLVAHGVLKFVNMGYEDYEGGRFPLYRVVLP